MPRRAGRDRRLAARAGRDLRRPRRHPPQGRAGPRRARVRGRDRGAVGAAGCRGARSRPAAAPVRRPPRRRADRLRVRRDPRQRRRRGARPCRSTRRRWPPGCASRTGTGPRCSSRSSLRNARPARRGGVGHRRRGRAASGQPRGRGVPRPRAPRRGWLDPGAVRAARRGRADEHRPRRRALPAGPDRLRRASCATEPAAPGAATVTSSAGAPSRSRGEPVEHLVDVGRGRGLAAR